MDGVGTPIIGRPRPIPGHDTPNPANNTYTLNYEEPENRRIPTIPFQILKYTKGNYVRHFWETMPLRRLAARHRPHTRLSLAEAAKRAPHPRESIAAIFSTVAPLRIVTSR